MFRGRWKIPVQWGRYPRISSCQFPAGSPHIESKLQVSSRLGSCLLASCLRRPTQAGSCLPCHLISLPSPAKSCTGCFSSLELGSSFPSLPLCSLCLECSFPIFSQLRAQIKCPLLRQGFLNDPCPTKKRALQTPHILLPCFVFL